MFLLLSAFASPVVLLIQCSTYCTAWVPVVSKLLHMHVFSSLHVALFVLIKIVMGPLRVLSHLCSCAIAKCQPNHVCSDIVKGCTMQSTCTRNKNAHWAAILGLNLVYYRTDIMWRCGCSDAICLPPLCVNLIFSIESEVYILTLKHRKCHWEEALLALSEWLLECQRCSQCSISLYWCQSCEKIRIAGHEYEWGTCIIQEGSVMT